jgi:hypothetical protein
MTIKGTQKYTRIANKAKRLINKKNWNKKVF